MRSLISPTYKDGIPERNKIPATDGVMGVIIMLAWWGGGKDLFLDSARPEFFAQERRRDGTVVIDVEGLTDLIGEHSKSVGREIGQLSVSSLPVYLGWLREGRRANGNGRIISVNTSFKRGPQTLKIRPRDYEADKENGLLRLMPPGVLPDQD